MRYAARIVSEQGKPRIAVGNEYLEIDITDGIYTLAKLIVRNGKLYDDRNNEIRTK